MERDGSMEMIATDVQDFEMMEFALIWTMPLAASWTLGFHKLCCYFLCLFLLLLSGRCRFRIRKLLSNIPGQDTWNGSVGSNKVLGLHVHHRGSEHPTDFFPTMFSNLL